MKKKGTLPGFFVLLLLIISACHKKTDDAVPALRNAAQTPGDFTTYKDVLYATDSVQQTMDVYLPATRDVVNTPVVIMIHGGGWYRGNKEDFSGLGLDTFFTSHGCALVNMNYRLDNKYQYPDPIFDIGLVMDYIKQKSKEWKINPDRVCLLGRSSGSQLAMMYAYNSNKDGRIKVVIDAFGPTNFTDSSLLSPTLGPLVSGLLGPFTPNKQAWHDASPINYVTTAVPTVIFQGTADSIVYFTQSAGLQESLLHNGVPCMFAVWDGYGHGWAQDKWLEWRTATYEWISRFL